VRAVLAHQGGWDEILLPIIAVLALLWVTRLRRRRVEPARPPATQDGDPPSTTCTYCGAAIPEDAPRCPSCGFRVRTG
jgi:hypothetical protein